MFSKEIEYKIVFTKEWIERTFFQIICFILILGFNSIYMNLRRDEKQY